MRRLGFTGVLAAGGLVLAGCGLVGGDSAEAPTIEHTIAPSTFTRDADVPDLPFDDNPDPEQCGIPTQWGLDEPAYLTGMWEGELIQPEVLLYDSHLRLGLSGSGEHGAEIRILLFQENPVLDYYLVEVVATGEEGWLPEPFLSFDPV